MNLKEDDLVLCTVKKIEGTNITVDIPNVGEGSLVFSEVAAGRIRNIRDYVVLNKKIVCKVLKIINNHPHLTLRRVTAKERESVLEKETKEKNLLNMFKAISKNPEKILEIVREKYDLVEFFDNLKENPKKASEFLSKEELTKLEKIISEKKETLKEAKRTIILKSFSEQGLSELKEVLSIKEATIHYLGSSQFSITAIAKDFKEANQILDKIIEEIETKAKSKKMFFELKEK